MTRHLSPTAIVTILQHGNSAESANICREWEHLRKRYTVGRPSLLPLEWLKNRDEYALSTGQIPPEEAVRMIFDGREPLTLYGTLPKWLVSTAFTSMPDPSLSSPMRTLYAKDLWGLVENDVWNDIFYGRFRCLRCSPPSDYVETYWDTLHVVHPKCKDWCLTLRFMFWDSKTDAEISDVKHVELFRDRFICRSSSDTLTTHCRRLLRLAEMRNEVFHWLSRTQVDKCSSVCKEWHAAIEWQWRTLPLYSGSVTIKPIEEAQQRGSSEDADGVLMYSIMQEVDDSDLVEDRRFHMPHDARRDSAIIRSHLRNFFASYITLDSLREEWLPWLRAMFAGLHNCHAGSFTLFEGVLRRRPADLTLHLIECTRPLAPCNVVMDLAPSMLDPHLRQGLLHPDRLGGLQKIELNMQASLEQGNDPVVIEPVWLDELFSVGDRHVTLWYGICERDDWDDDFDASNITSVLLEAAKQFQERDTSDFVATFDFKLFGSSVELNVPKERPDVVDVKVDDFQELLDDESRDQWSYGNLDFVNHWDAYYFKNNVTNDELTILLKRPVDNFTGFRLKRGRLSFDTEKNDD